MDIDVLFASAAVSDLGRAQGWYERFFGRPPDIVPNKQELIWKANDSAWVYVIYDVERAGHGVITWLCPTLGKASQRSPFEVSQADALNG